MFGYYTEKKFTDRERKILRNEPDDYIWYMIILQNLFREGRLFEIREDIKIPEDNDGKTIIFKKGQVGYFKTLTHKAEDDDIKQIKKSCSYLSALFGGHVDAYIAHTADCKTDMVKEYDDLDCTIHFKSLEENNGEEIILKLENKLNSHEPYTIYDSIDHILLPFIGGIDQERFNRKYHHYMEHIESCDVDGNGVL